MANKVTDAQRRPIYTYAEQHVKLANGYGRVVNLNELSDDLRERFGISRDRAYRAIAHGARQQRKTLQRNPRA